MSMIPGAGTPVSDIPEPQSFEAIPAGKRLAIITEGGMEDSNAKKAGTGIGESLVLKFQIVEGQNQGSNVFERFNLIHENTTTIEIAYRELAALCRTLGLATIPGHPQELFNKPVVIDVGLEAGKSKNDAGKWVVDPNKKPQNKINSYAPAATWAAVQGGTPPPAAAPVYAPPAAAQPVYTPPAAPAAPKGGKPPWVK